MRHSQLEGQCHLEAGGKNEGEEMSEDKVAIPQANAFGLAMPSDISYPELFPPAERWSVPRDGAMPKFFSGM